MKSGITLNTAQCSILAKGKDQKAKVPCDICKFGPCIKNAGSVSKAVSDKGDTLEPRRLPINTDTVFTLEQRKAIVAIIDGWWEAKMASIETGKVLELSDKLDYIMASMDIVNPTSAQVQQWRLDNPRR